MIGTTTIDNGLANVYSKVCLCVPKIKKKIVKMKSNYKFRNI